MNDFIYDSLAKVKTGEVSNNMNTLLKLVIISPTNFIPFVTGVDGFFTQFEGDPEQS